MSQSSIKSEKSLRPAVDRAERGHSLPAGRRASRLPITSVFIIQTLLPHGTEILQENVKTPVPVTTRHAIILPAGLHRVLLQDPEQISSDDLRHDRPNHFFSHSHFQYL